MKRLGRDVWDGLVMHKREWLMQHWAWVSWFKSRGMKKGKGDVKSLIEAVKKYMSVKQVMESMTSIKIEYEFSLRIHTQPLNFEIKAWLL